jgi:molecular chaperone GrpE (heat shock protein)
MRNPLLLFGALSVFLSLSAAQNPSAVASGMREDAIYQRTRGKVTVTEESHTVSAPDIDKMQQKSEELNRLAKELDADFSNLRKGVVSTEMSHRLKRIEKLAKEIRQGLE